MKIVVAAYGSRGDVEPAIAVGAELLRRGHEVRVAVTVPAEMWAAAVEYLEVGFGRRFAESTGDSLTADLQRILAPQCAARARTVATHMATPSESLSSTADYSNQPPVAVSTADRFSRKRRDAPAAPAGCRWRQSSAPG